MGWKNQASTDKYNKTKEQKNNTEKCNESCSRKHTVIIDFVCFNCLYVPIRIDEHVDKRPGNPATHCVVWVCMDSLCIHLNVKSTWTVKHVIYTRVFSRSHSLSHSRSLSLFIFDVNFCCCCCFFLNKHLLFSVVVSRLAAPFFVIQLEMTSFAFNAECSTFGWLLASYY